MMGLGGLVYAHDQKRIALTGKGVLVGPDEGPVREARKGLSDRIVDATSPVESRLFDGREGRHYFRPYFVCPVECQDVLIEGVTLRNGPMWNIVPVYCNQVIVRGVTIDSRGVVNGDGVNVDSSRNVLIEYCSTNTGDDCYAIKAGRNADGIRVARLSREYPDPPLPGHRRFRRVSRWEARLPAGCGMSASVTVCFENVRHAAYFKTRRPRGGGGEGLLVERVRFRSDSHAIFFDMIGSPMYVGELGERLPLRRVNEATPRYSDVTVRDVTGVAGGEALKIKGIPESPASEVRIERVDIRSQRLVNMADADGVTIVDSKFTPMDPTIRLLDTRRVRFVRTRFEVAEGESQRLRQEAFSGPLATFEDCDPSLSLAPHNGP